MKKLYQNYKIIKITLKKLSDSPTNGIHLAFNNSFAPLTFFRKWVT